MIYSCAGYGYRDNFAAIFLLKVTFSSLKYVTLSPGNGMNGTLFKVSVAFSSDITGMRRQRGQAEREKKEQGEIQEEKTKPDVGTEEREEKG